MTAKKLVMSAMLAALACVMTMVVQIPSPMEGYVHLGDSVVLLCGFMLSPVCGALAAGIGSALADLFSGYGHYVVATFIIKAAMALVAHAIFQGLTRKNKHRVAALVVGGITAELLMVVGYFCFSAFVRGSGMAAFASVPGNLVQGAFAVISVVPLTNTLLRREKRDHNLH